MGKIVVYVAMSLDGFIAASDGSAGFLDAYQSEDYGYDEFIAGIDVLVMGSKTYEQIPSLAVEWPYGERVTFVMTSRDLPSQSPKVRLTSEEPKRVARAAKASAGDGDVWLVGGGEAIGSFLQAGLVDEVWLFVVPVLLGDGVPLAVGLRTQAPLRVTASKVHANGVLELRGEPLR